MLLNNEPVKPYVKRYDERDDKVTSREVKLETMLASLIERGGYSRNRQPILEAVGVTAAALSQYTRGRTRPSFQKLVALARFFGVTLDYLVYGEPVSTPIAQDPIARNIAHALADVQSRANRHTDLVARVGRILVDRIDNVAQELVDSHTAGLEGLIEQEELLRVERSCRQVNIVTTDLRYDIIWSNKEPVAGQFFHEVAANLIQGCKYRFLLGRELGTHSEEVFHFREMLGQAVGGDRVHANCSFRRSALPVMSGWGLYELDPGTFATAEPGLFTQISKYLLNGAWLGYLNRPNVDSNADILMSPDYTELAQGTFESLWSAADSRI